MLELMDWFCGAGGSSQGAHSVPGVRVTRAANHWARAIETHAANFPDTDHHLGDIREAPVARWPVADLFWASPECPQWSSARGRSRDFHNTMQPDLFDTPRDAEADRSRALMEEVPMYLRGVIARGGKVRAGVVENVIEVRAWDQWDRWLGEIRALGYRVRVIALNSMHAQTARTPVAPQSRDRLYVAYWDTSLGREPDWSKWLRPQAYCARCQAWVAAMQVFKTEGADMGRYRQQYVYRCPRVRCRNAVVEPPALPAAAAIDWTIEGERIGDRERPLAEKTMERIRIGLARYAVPQPLMVPAGGTWRVDPSPVTVPLSARTTRENDALLIPQPFLALLRSGRPRTIGVHEQLATIVADGSNHALVSPPPNAEAEGRDGGAAAPVTLPERARTTRAETAVAFLPFTAEPHSGSGGVRSADATVSAGSERYGLVVPAGLPPLVRDSLLLPYYGTGAARPVDQPMGTQSTRDRFALVEETNTALVEDVRFRMLQPHEIGRAMAFTTGYTVLGNKRERVRQYGNAVTPPVAELLVSALVEAITGEDIERWAA
ncbi:DNA cytosine methyltransferase [Nocardia bovistercoris]|uniref:DNA (cytosine-5-)-methyltransferase n=1 Tax=Nocardia bovistercoris TaxID=2785916 RepID=A0A931I550_9NOCA|nr:DNA cytosine methyltransferase [Nocardia bovistercoris]MBH0775047.1 DNA cytosine methyltransferase [Nocardia bovistercoris]